MKPQYTVRLLCLLLFPLLTGITECQISDELENSVSIAIRGHYGFIIPHSRAIEEISNSNPWGIEADLAWHLMRERIWKHCYCYPRTGVSLNYFNFNFPEVLGHSVALYPYIEPYIRPQEKLSISFRFGIGPAYVTKVYDAGTNPDNFFFGDHLSFIVVLNAAVNYRLNSRISTRVAFNYNHISNGGISQPNVGMNFPALNAGIDYSFTEVSFPRREKDTLKILYTDKCWWNAYFLGTAKDAEKGEDNSYPVIGAGIYYNYLVGRIIALNAGTEWISDFSVKEQIRREYINDPGSAPDHNRAAILIGLDLLFGRFSFVYQWGIYYYEPYPARNRAYQRYGLNFRFSERFYLGINIKSHGHVADLMDARLGILF
ncbi:MAG TPA: acyloxyacyl hydrolase [Bacteroides sp.]|nr:acyloxyacyl hydrolase [Bacteroides sp.]